QSNLVALRNALAQHYAGRKLRPARQPDVVDDDRHVVVRMHADDARRLETRALVSVHAHAILVGWSRERWAQAAILISHSNKSNRILPANRVNRCLLYPTHAQ